MQKFDSDMTLVEMVYVGEILALIISLRPDIYHLVSETRGLLGWS